MQQTFCDSCGTAVPAYDPASITLTLAYKRYVLCDSCSAGIVEMLKDLGVYKEKRG